MALTFLVNAHVALPTAPQLLCFLRKAKPLQNKLPATVASPKEIVQFACGLVRIGSYHSLSTENFVVKGIGPFQLPRFVQ